MRVEAKKHIDLIDILKGVAIISVLICHSVIVYPVNLEEVAWCNILKDLWILIRCRCSL